MGMRLGLQPEVPQGPVGQILTHEGYAKIALVDLGREANDALRASWPAAREESIVFYRERDGRRILKAYHTRDLRLQQAVA